MHVHTYIYMCMYLYTCVYIHTHTNNMTLGGAKSDI